MSGAESAKAASWPTTLAIAIVGPALTGLFMLITAFLFTLVATGFVEHSNRDELLNFVSGYIELVSAISAIFVSLIVFQSVKKIWPETDFKRFGFIYCAGYLLAGFVFATLGLGIMFKAGVSGTVVPMIYFGMQRMDRAPLGVYRKPKH